jgi:[protein-PII] uridylyltransferase
VKDVFGLKIENERKLASLREALLEALGTPEELPAPEIPEGARRRRVDAA